MTQYPHINDDTMTLVDANALATTNIKKNATVEDHPVDNQIDHDTAMETTTSSKQERRITFSTADVIEFEPTLWTATVASDGVPVGLSSTVRRRTRRRLDSLESERLLHRVNRQEYMEHGYLEPEERVDMLEAAGHSLAIMSHVERESMRVNRERWESNEYDLLYQFGLGEEAIMDLSEEDELLLSQGCMPGYQSQQDDAPVIDDEDDEMLEDEDDAGNPADYYYYPNRSTVPSEMNAGYSMEEMDTFDTRKYEEWAWDYTTDCILGDDNEDKDASLELPNLDFDLPEMSSSPTDISGSGDSVLAKVIGSDTSSGSNKVSSPRLFI